MKEVKETVIDTCLGETKQQPLANAEAGQASCIKLRPKYKLQVVNILQFFSSIYTVISRTVLLCILLPPCTAGF
jgi:hypothetical protein